MTYMQNNLAFAGGIQELSLEEIGFVGGGSVDAPEGSPLLGGTKSKDFEWGDFKITCCSVGPFSMNIFALTIPLIEAAKPKEPEYTGKTFTVNGWTCKETTTGSICTAPKTN